MKAIKARRLRTYGCVALGSAFDCLCAGLVTQGTHCLLGCSWDNKFAETQAPLQEDAQRSSEPNHGEEGTLIREQLIRAQDDTEQALQENQRLRSEIAGLHRFVHLPCALATMVLGDPCKV